MKKQTVKAIQKRLDLMKGDNLIDKSFVIGNYRYDFHFHHSELKPFVLMSSVGGGIIISATAGIVDMNNWKFIPDVEPERR